MQTEDFLQEAHYLEEVENKLTRELNRLEQEIDTRHQHIKETHQYIIDNRHEMDSMEIFTTKKTLTNETIQLEQYALKKERLKRMQETPYFGRIDFRYAGDEKGEEEAYYIGMGDFTVQGEQAALVYDWRAPISSLYYDYEVGPATYEAPVGVLEGELLKKKQYKIKKRQLEYVLDSEMKIDDEILQRELSHTADSKMKNIVATIQKEQNAIVRNEEAPVMVVQGIAGSGKTSIALHRIAYLLYKSREELKSSNILILSPNPVFSDYISSVLPELGEENITEMGLEELVAQELIEGIQVEGRCEQLEFLLQKGMQVTQRKRNIDFKESVDFLTLLKSFIELLPEKNFRPESLSWNGFNCEKEELQMLFYEKYKSKPLFKRLQYIADYIADKKESDTNKTMTSKIRKELENKLKDYMKETKLMVLYSDFIAWCNKTQLKEPFLLLNKGMLHYEDAFPLIYLKYALYGHTSFPQIKHLVIDEMQDYSFIQFELLKTLFNCRMTILGDMYQVLEPKEPHVLTHLMHVFSNPLIIKLNRTYRSTFEIATFAKNMIGQQDMIAFERHGEEPSLIKTNSYEEMLEQMVSDLEKLDQQKYASVAILCKTAQEAEKMYKELKDKLTLTLFTAQSTAFETGIVITTSYLAKGLEFDVVCIPNAEEDYYQSPVDKQVLYISATRALHLLKFYYYKTLTSLLIAN